MAKCVVLGITGSIAAYKAAEIASALTKQGVSVFGVMTAAAQKFISPLTIESITHNPVACDMFARDIPWEIEHISLAKRADVFLIAPATANFIGKCANGIADDMLTTTVMATHAPLIIAPAMNSAMYLSAANQQNMITLKSRRTNFIAPATGVLACGDEGIGKLAAVQDILERTLALLAGKTDFSGKRVLISAGPTREIIDPVRYISNRSSGKMGYAIARAARDRGAHVVLVSGPTSIVTPFDIETHKVETTQQMYDKMIEQFECCDVCIMAAAPADFTPIESFEHKIKKAEGTPIISLAPTPDILAELGRRKRNRFLCGFAAETRDLDRYAIEKLEKKNLDMIAANDVSNIDAGFDVDTNAVKLYFREGSSEILPNAPKSEIAQGILDNIAGVLGLRK